ncbi:unnamed protein product [Amoebophrya sp. A120]|nr:unnamed protein product [Amoebophrya sp. A120]|eukprot:GSA120T00024180001.1
MLPCNDTTMFESAWSRCTSGEGNYEPAVTQAAFSCVSGKHGRAAASSSGRETSTSILFPRPPQGLTSKLLSDSASAAKRSRNKDEKSADRQREKNLGPRLGLAGQHGAPDDDDGDMELVAATIAALSLKKPTPPTSDTPSSFEPYETDSLLDRGGATIHSSASTPGSTSATSSGAGRAGGRAHHFPFLPTSAPQEQFLAPSTLVSRQDEQEQYGHLLSALRHTALRNETIVELRAAGAGSSSIDEARRRISRTSARTSVSPSQTDVEDGLQLPRSSADHWQRPARLQASRSEQPGTKEKEKRQRASPGGSARPGHSTGLLDQRDWEMTEKSSSSAQDEQGHNQMDHHQQFLLSTAVVAAFGGRPGLLASSRSAAGESSLPQQEERDGHEATSFMARQLHVRPPPRSWSRQHQQEEAGASTASTRPGRWYEQQRTGARGSGVFDGRGAALGPEYRTRTPSPAGAFSVRSWSSNSSQSLGEEGSPEAEPQEDSTSTRVDTFDSLPDCDVDGVEGPAQQRLPLPGDDSNDTANPSAAGGFPVGATTPGAAAPLTTPGVPAPPQAPCPEDDQAMF